MSSEIPNALYPVVVVQDRFQGVYSGGHWLAIAAADTPECGMPRASWVLKFGPGAGDVEAAIFWVSAPDWITPGMTPDSAIESLIAKRIVPVGNPLT